jgi:hypothetical protein
MRRELATTVLSNRDFHIYLVIRKLYHNDKATKSKQEKLNKKTVQQYSVWQTKENLKNSKAKLTYFGAVLYLEGWKGGGWELGHQRWKREVEMSMGQIVHSGHKLLRLKGAQLDPEGARPAQCEQWTTSTSACS